LSGFKTRYQVDEVPWYWWLPMQVYAWSIALPMWLYLVLVWGTSRIEYRGYALDPEQNYVFCFWHHSIFSYMCLSPRLDRVSFMVHPLWYMSPSHAVGRLMGVRSLVLGSSGNQGRDSAERLTELVRQGDNTFFTPDGPYGPPGQVGQGALHVALHSDTPLVGMTIRGTRFIRLRGWDRKLIFRPFGKITVNYSEPFHPREESMEDSIRQLVSDMGAAELD
jgi:lysophospholipid acyltransferase (LPLAT)-like uncharacterized protein